MFLTTRYTFFARQLLSNSTMEATIETPTPVPIPTLVPLPGTVVPTPIGGPTIVPTPVEERDPYGELYFSIVTPKEYYPPATPPGYDETTRRLTRLPGSCVVGLMECPEAETVQTPFNVKDVWDDGTGIVWSPDGRYGLLITHPEDKHSAGKTKEELDKIEHQSLSEFQVSPIL